MDTVQEIIGRKAIHPFPARMAPSIALEALADGRRPRKILDPMCGSGTVLAVARAHGHQAFGIDCDPLAVLNSTVWTTTVDREQVTKLAKTVLHRAKARVARNGGDAYPSQLDDETRAFVDYWFDPLSRCQLTALAACIRRIRDQAVQRVLWVAFSRMIITKKSGVSLAMDLSHSRPHRVFKVAPVQPFEIFPSATRHVVENCPDPEMEHLERNSNVQLGDNRLLPFKSGFFDLVITSPPYLNAIDYIRCSKFSLVWMGYSISDLRRIRSESVGSESGVAGATTDQVADLVAAMADINLLSSRQRGLLARYVTDMTASVSEVARVLKQNGRVVYVVGNNQMTKVFVRNSEAIKLLAEKAGLRLEAENVRELPPNQRYLPAPSHNNAGKSMQARMRTEVVLKFRKT